MSSIIKASALFIIYTFVIIVAFSILDSPVTDVLTIISDEAQDMGLNISKDLLITVWHAIPAILLLGMLLWFVMWIQRVEPEEYMEVEE